jgi:myosin-1
LAYVKAVKDPAAGAVDNYKSSTIHTSAGEPPSSVSKPTPRAKQVAARPVTKGKLLRPGGPGGGPSKLSAAARKPAPAPQPLPQSTPQPAAQSRIVPQPVAAVTAAVAAHSRNESTSSVRAPPPPPPAAPPAAAAAPKKPTAKVLYDFSSDRANELTIRTGEIVQIVSKEGNGMLFPISNLQTRT